MAIYTPGPLIGAMSGKIGGMVAVQARGARVLRRPPTRTPRRTAFKATSDALFANIRAGWHDLTDDERSAFVTAARDFPNTNRLGETRPLSGFQLFIKINMELRLEPGSFITDAPTDGVGGPPLSVTADLQEVGDFDIGAQPPFGFGTAQFFVYGWIYCTDHAVRDAPRLVFLTKVTAASLDEDVRDEWELHFGPAATGQPFRIGVAAKVAATLRSQIVLLEGTITA